MAEFIEGDDTSVDLNFNHQNFPGFVLIQHGSPVHDIEIKMCTDLGIADYFPVLNDNSIVFRCFSRNIDSVLRDRQMLAQLVHDNHMSDALKVLIRTLGFLALRCFLGKINLDLTLEQLYVGCGDYMRLKGIVLKDDGLVVDFEAWKSKLLTSYKEIADLCFTPKENQDWEFQKFIKLLNDSRTPREVESHLNSVLFWSKLKRLSVILKLGNMVDIQPHRLYRTLDQANQQILHGWRATMNQDPRIQLLMNNFRIVNGFHGTMYYNATEVDCLLRFLRSTFAHFTTTSQVSGISSASELLAHYDFCFPEIMYTVYMGSLEVQVANLYNLDLDNM